MWVHTPDQMISLWTVDAPQSFNWFDFGPYAGWRPMNFAVGLDNKVRVLWSNPSTGMVSLWDVDPTNQFYYEDFNAPQGGTPLALTPGVQ